MSEGYRCRRDLQFFATGDQNKNSVPCLSERRFHRFHRRRLLERVHPPPPLPLPFHVPDPKKLPNSILSFGDDLMPIMLLVFTACYEIQHVLARDENVKILGAPALHSPTFWVFCLTFACLPSFLPFSYFLKGHQLSTPPSFSANPQLFICLAYFEDRLLTSQGPYFLGRPPFWSLHYSYTNSS